MNHLGTELTAAQDQSMTAFMRTLSLAPVERDMNVPTADVLWLKAQLIRRWDAQRRVFRPLDVMESIEMAASLAAAILLLAWSVPSAFASFVRVIF